MSDDTLFSAPAQAVADVLSPVADALLGTGAARDTRDAAGLARAGACPCGQPRDDGRHLIAAADDALRLLGDRDHAG